MRNMVPPALEGVLDMVLGRDKECVHVCVVHMYV